ncbi:MAG TPA: hypothetical protein VN989_01335, partial [Casimicrobiaceae bacterium]|nr:hypothetical protein [Casimicrobiaceae bacterium]
LAEFVKRPQAATLHHTTSVSNRRWKRVSAQMSGASTHNLFQHGTSLEERVFQRHKRSSSSGHDAYGNASEMESRRL